MKVKFFLGLFLALSTLCHSEEKEYEFYGPHFKASYRECDVEALTNIAELKKVLEQAVIASGATIRGDLFIEFDGNGLTGTLVLQESHASIHTYPEHGSCFVDLFTCGRTCTWEPFDKALQEYLKPKNPSTNVEIRS